MVRFSAAASAVCLLAAGSVDAFLAPQSRVAVSTTSASAGRTLYDKIWDDHVVTQDDSSALIYIDRHLVHEVSWFKLAEFAVGITLIVSVFVFLPPR